MTCCAKRRSPWRRALTGQVMGAKAIAVTDERSCALVQKAVPGPPSRAKAAIERAGIAGVVSWRVG